MKNNMIKKAVKKLQKVDFSYLLRGAAIGFPTQLVSEIIGVNGKFSWKRLLGATAQSSVACFISYVATGAALGLFDDEEEPTEQSADVLSSAIKESVKKAEKEGRVVKLSELDDWDIGDNFREVHDDYEKAVNKIHDYREVVNC
jgi:hypothetical protein